MRAPTLTVGCSAPPVPAQRVVFERLPGDSPVSLAPVTVSYAAPVGAPYLAEDVTVHTPAGFAPRGHAHRAEARRGQTRAAWC